MMELETQKEQMLNRFKSWKFWAKTVGILFLVVIIYTWGSASAKVEMEDEKLSLQDLNQKIDDRKKQIKDFDEELKVIAADVEKIKGEYESQKTKIDEAMEVMKNKEKIESEIVSLQSDIDTKKGEISNLDETIKVKSNELSSLQGKIEASGDEPVTLPAGFFTVGKDIPASRYKAVATGESGNFFVNGGAKVNIILGTDGFGQSEYVFEAVEGDEFESTMGIKFTPIE
jgi:cell division protein FtsL